jgi:hypothetical protein
MAKPIVLKVNLTQSEYDRLAAVADARDTTLGATLRSLIHNHLPPSNDGLENTRCTQLPN